VLDEVVERVRAVGAIPLRHRVARGDDRSAHVVRVGRGEDPGGDPGVDRPAEAVAGLLLPRAVAPPLLRLERPRLVHQQQARLRALGAVADRGADHGGEPARRVVPGLGRRLRAARLIVVHALVQQRRQQGLFARVVVIQGGQAHPRRRGDLADRDGVITPLGELRRCGGEQGLVARRTCGHGDLHRDGQSVLLASSLTSVR
jgi:hypothetical protein